ncbi:MAG: hypothetical protein F6K39_28870 [Okeania sp. SIO3B3]|nr:hypothetical protein [Okeania sp. SIO3B3]
MSILTVFAIAEVKKEEGRRKKEEERRKKKEGRRKNIVFSEFYSEFQVYEVQI